MEAGQNLIITKKNFYHTLLDNSYFLVTSLKSCHAVSLNIVYDLSGKILRHSTLNKNPKLNKGTYPTSSFVNGNTMQSAYSKKRMYENPPGELLITLGQRY